MMTRRELLTHTGCVSIAASLAPTALFAQPQLIMRPIPKTGELLPVVGLGTYRTFDVGADDSEREPLRQVTQEFFNLGGRLVDSSPRYGPAEAAFGEVLENISNAGNIFAATKVSADGLEDGLRQMRESPEKMGVERIDLMQIHNLRDWKTHMPVLKAWKDEGRFRYIGISASNVELYEEYVRVMRSEPLDFIQINYSVAERASEVTILPLAQDLGMAVLINRPFVAGALFREVAGKPLPDWAADFDCTSWAQFFLKFVLSHPAVTVAIQATSDVDHLRDNMAAGSGGMPGPKARQQMVDFIGLSGRPPWD